MRNIEINVLMNVELLRVYTEQFGAGYSQIVPDNNLHVTLHADCQGEAPMELRQLLGNICEFRIVAIGKSNDALAVKVELPTYVTCSNKIAHITLAHNGKPVMSNFIEEWKPLEEPIPSGGLIEVHIYG